MNDITKAAVIEASSNNKSIARKASEGETYWIEQFHWQVKEEWWGLVILTDGYHLRQRAERLWKRVHQEHFIKMQNMSDPRDEYLDEDIDIHYFTPLINRILERHINNHPELQLQDYSDYLRQLHPIQIKMFEE